MTSMATTPRRGRVVIGVDTHKFVHVAAAFDDFGAVLDTGTFQADRAGYAELIEWASHPGHILTFAIEGTGSYGAGLTAAVRRSDIGVVEVMRTDRRDRRLRGKSDFLDAENAARAVLGSHATATPKTADDTVDMIRQIKIAKNIAVKARSAAMISLKTVIVNAPDELREQLQPLSKMALIRRYAGLRPAGISTVEAATKHTLRSIARRWQHLNEEITEHEKLLAQLVTEIAPELTAAFGIGADTAAEMLIVAGDNPTGSVLKPRGPSCAACARSQPPPAKPFATCSTGMATARLMRRSTAPSSWACNTINPPRRTSQDAPPKASPRPKSSGA